MLASFFLRSSKYASVGRNGVSLETPYRSRKTSFFIGSHRGIKKTQINLHRSRDSTVKTKKSRTVLLFRCSDAVRAAGSKILAAFLFFSAGLVLLDGKNILILFFAVIIQISIEKRISICYNMTERTETVIFQEAQPCLLQILKPNSFARRC